ILSSTLFPYTTLFRSYPENNINIGKCLQRKAQGIFVFPILRSDCSFSYETYQAAGSREIEFLRTMEQLDHINVVWPERVTCDNRSEEHTSELQSPCNL